MNTVAHPDGQLFSTTGRHPQGGRVAASSVDTMLVQRARARAAAAHGERALPVGVRGRQPRPARRAAGDRRRRLDQPHARARLRQYDADPERDLVTAMLSEEARDLAKRSTYPDVLDGHGLQYEGLRKMLGEQPARRVQRRGPEEGPPRVRLQVALHRRRRGQRRVRRRGDQAQPRALRELRHRRVRHPRQQLPRRRRSCSRRRSSSSRRSCARSTRRRTRSAAGAKLSEHTHILVVSDFCRTPQINLGMGRDHYPNNSALVVSPRFRPNFVFGKTDPEQLLPAPAQASSPTASGQSPRRICSPRSSRAFGVDPRKYMRDGEVVPELLRS